MVFKTIFSKTNWLEKKMNDYEIEIILKSRFEYQGSNFELNQIEPLKSIQNF